MNGILLINKQKGMTSRDVVNKVSRILGIKQIGHTGTLDPLATGVLVLCIGSATKIAELITAYDKEYIAGVKLGIETDTFDIEGNILKEETVKNMSFDKIKEVLKDFIGHIRQEVPLYSAIKVNGKRLYKYAREGKKVDLPVREVEIYNIKLLDKGFIINNTFMIQCHVSKGTYVRSLVHDIGIKLNTLATMSSLTRIRQGNFKIEDCYTLDDIESGDYKLLSIKDVLTDIKEVIVNEDVERQIRNGNITDKTFDGDIAKMINKTGYLLAIYKTYEKDSTKAKPYKMFI
jgi:tRNA pseudouridine55 synthase